MRSTSFVLIAVFVVLCPDQARAQNMPDEIAKHLSRLVGKWQVETRMGDEVTKSNGYAKWAPEKECIIWGFKGTDVVTGLKYSSTGLIGWDNVEKTTMERGFSSDGETFTATCEFKSPDGWISPVQAVVRTVDGKFKPAKSKRIVTWKSPDVMEIRATERKVDGEARPEIVSVFRRLK
ncbi:MAG: hypothetical protein ACYTG0_10905 [Planctomycetota bacterium]|jgi:hypothetical protein